MPMVVIKFATDWLHNGLEGSRSQVNDQGDGAVFQSQVDIIGRLARVQDQPVTLPCLEGECDLIAATLNGVLREVIAQIFRSTESGYILIPRCKKEETETKDWSVLFCEIMKCFKNSCDILIFCNNY